MIIYSLITFLFIFLGWGGTPEVVNSFFFVWILWTGLCVVLAVASKLVGATLDWTLSCGLFGGILGLMFGGRKD